MTILSSFYPPTIIHPGFRCKNNLAFSSFLAPKLEINKVNRVDQIQNNQSVCEHENTELKNVP